MLQGYMLRHGQRRSPALTCPAPPPLHTPQSITSQEDGWRSSPPPSRAKPGTRTGRGCQGAGRGEACCRRRRRAAVAGREPPCSSSCPTCSAASLHLASSLGTTREGAVVNHSGSCGTRAGQRGRPHACC